MDLADIVLVLIFLALPLLQQLFGKRAPPPPPLDPEAEGESGREGDAERAAGGAPPMEVEQRAENHPMPGASKPTGQTASRPLGRMEKAEQLARREVVDEKEAAELEELQATLSRSQLPEAVRVSSPVVSMEPLRVERHAKPPRPPAPSLPARPRPRAAEGPGSLLHGPGTLRRAILTSEVLGPPKSLE